MVQLLAQVSNGVQVLGVDYADVRRQVEAPNRITRVDFVDPETLEVICPAELPDDDRVYDGHIEVYRDGDFLGAITLGPATLNEIRPEVDQQVRFFTSPLVIPDIAQIERGFRVFVQTVDEPYSHIVEVQGRIKG